MAGEWLPREEWLKTLDARAGSAAVLIENSRGELLIIKANYKTHWGLPGGIIDTGESPLEAAIREVKEEVNIDLTPRELSFFAVASRQSAERMTYQFIFRATVDDEKLTGITLQESEISEYGFISKTEVADFFQPLLWAIEQWANDQPGYFETTRVEENGLWQETVKRCICM